MDEREIFIQVIQLAAPLERAAMIEKACGGGASPRQRVQTLLDAHERAAEFLETPPTALGQPAAVDRPPHEQPGMRVGRNIRSS